MQYITLNICRFAKKHELVARNVHSFIRHQFGKAVRKQEVELTREEYRILRSYFTEESQMVVHVFYNPGRDPCRRFKNVIKLTRLSQFQYCYEWFRYMVTNGKLTRIKLGDISVNAMERLRVWRSPIDRTVVILNENNQFEALSQLPLREG